MFTAVAVVVVVIVVSVALLLCKLADSCTDTVVAAIFSEQTDYGTNPYVVVVAEAEPTIRICERRSCSKKRNDGSTGRKSVNCLFHDVLMLVANEPPMTCGRSVAKTDDGRISYALQDSPEHVWKV